MNVPPNPKPHTNSEMDSKTIIKQPNLTTQQWDDLIEQYVDLCVDSMDYKSLEEFVRQTLIQDFGEIQSREELCDEIRYTYDQDLLDELVDNVTSEKCTSYQELIESNTKDYTKQLNNQGG